jgi:hypothetical protein
MKLFLLFTALFTVNIVVAQKMTFTDSIDVAAKVWSRDANKKIQYADWKIFNSHTINQINGFKISTPDIVCEYGGDKTQSTTATGFFRTEKIRGRFWMVDPHGHLFITKGVNSIRPGNSTELNQFLINKFGSNSNWINSTLENLGEFSFNTAGSWSDLKSILSYNKTSKGFPYTIQLSLLAGYAQKKKNKTKDYPILSFVFSKNFDNYLVSKLNEYKEYFSDQNLLGYFSDNELPFQSELLTDFLALNDESDEGYVAAREWVTSNGIDIEKISKEQQKIFSGFVAETYFKKVNEQIKQADPNHLYLGSRLHASAKNNDAVLLAAQKYIDVISINYYGAWDLSDKHSKQWLAMKKPFFITEFYTKGEDTKMANMSGAGWLVKTQADRGIHYQNFCIQLMLNENCVGWHWFRYQDNDPNDKSADQSNQDSNKGMLDIQFSWYNDLTNKMRLFNERIYQLIKFIDK